MPYMTEVYYYLGETSEYFTQGKPYRVIEVGNHWDKPYEYGAWMTCDDCPDTNDIDYGVFVDEGNFGKGKDFVKY